ncbi:MAG: peptidoglycan-binding protein [Rhodobacteraceae bacterium]|nr:peptidoglycan-binding protein [Paracoccaceae bacterium]
MRYIRSIGALGAVFALAGCVELELVGITDTAATEADQRPPNAEPGICYGRTETAAVIETVTKQVVARPAVLDANGVVVSPAAYQTESLQTIVRERQNVWFTAPCPEQMVGDFNASLQRALKVRGHYSGPVTGKLDHATRQAIRRFQKPLGLDSETLSLASARKLGLVAVERPVK